MSKVAGISNCFLMQRLKYIVKFEAFMTNLKFYMYKGILCLTVTIKQGKIE